MVKHSFGDYINMLIPRPEAYQTVTQHRLKGFTYFPIKTFTWFGPLFSRYLKNGDFNRHNYYELQEWHDTKPLRVNWSKL